MTTEHKPQKTPFQKVTDDLTGGCGCACHTGTGYRTSCEHCRPVPEQQREPMSQSQKQNDTGSKQHSTQEAFDVIAAALAVGEASYLKAELAQDFSLFNQAQAMLAGLEEQYENAMKLALKGQTREAEILRLKEQVQSTEREMEVLRQTCAISFSDKDVGIAALIRRAEAAEKQLEAARRALVSPAKAL